MGSDIVTQPQWRRTPDGDVILRPIEQWKAGLTEHGDIAICFATSQGTDPASAPGEPGQAQFICTQEDARAIAQLLLRVAVLSGKKQVSGWDAFRARIKSPALRALADDWNRARGTRQMPGWVDIAPGPSAPYLGGIWAFDYRHEADEFFVRAAGPNILFGYNKNYRGEPLRKLYAPHVYEQARPHLMQVISEPACVLYSGKLFRKGDRLFEGERLILPIGADAQTPGGVLGATHSEFNPLAVNDAPVELIVDIADWHKL